MIKMEASNISQDKALNYFRSVFYLGYENRDGMKMWVEINLLNISKVVLWCF